MTQRELEKLLKDMTLEEKINQLLQVTAGFYLGDTIITGPMRENGFTEENIALAGSVIGVSEPEKIIQIQKEYMEKHPHHIPLLMMLDVINGMRTVFPIPLGQGATFEPELSKRCARAAAKEAAVSGVHVTFAPMADLVRDARWGRVMESTGEDGYLNGKFSAAMVEGFQGDDLKEPYHVAACVKHFAGYGAAEAGRDYNTVELTEQTFRDAYLPAYKEGIDAGSALMMTSFNTVNGIPATGNRWLMQDILRKEMGFDGVLISDWAAIEEMIAHGYCEDRKQAAQRAINAGVDIDMMTGIYSEELTQLIEEGIVTMKQVDTSAMRVLMLKNKLGLFENPFKDANIVKAKEILLCQEHRHLAREAAAKSMVLLKNSGVLPLKNDEKIAFIGPYVEEKEIMGAWSFLSSPEYSVSIREAAEEVLTNVIYKVGCPRLNPGDKLLGFEGKDQENWSRERLKEERTQAIKAAKEADIVVMALGEHRLQSGEAASRTEIQIPQVQMELFREICTLGKPVAVVLFSGRPLDVRELAQKSNALVAAWMPGTEGGHGVMDVLTGAYNPSGKLTMSFPYSVGQLPIHYNEFLTGRPKTPEREEKYLSQYIDAPNEPLYPFGYGLSYTTFQVGEVKLTKRRMTKAEVIQAQIVVKNTGDVEGTETIQMYIRDVVGSTVRPKRELKGFKKVTLSPGEETTVSFDIWEEMLRFFTENQVYESETGKFIVFVGTDSQTENHAEFILV